MKTKLLLLTTLAIVLWLNVSAVNITIIRSKGVFSWSIQDTIWRDLATSMGYNATIDSETILNDTAFFSTTDVLVISEAALSFTNTELQNVITFVKRGKSVYVQAEYQPTFQGDITFQAIMDSIGAGFSWGSSVAGDLAPMQILPPFSTTPYKNDSIGYFNYGLDGTGSGVDSFLIYDNQNFGFYYRQTIQNYGRVVTCSDEDWVWQNYDSLLMKNILYYLVTNTTGINTINSKDQINIYPNPSEGIFFVEMPKITGAKWNVYDLWGRQVSSGKISNTQESQFDFSYLPRGNYILNIFSAEFNMAKKIEIVK